MLLFTARNAAFVALALAGMASCSITADPSDASVAVSPAAQERFLVDAEGAAVHGYDVVAYQVDGRPRRGLARHAARHQGVEWLFATSENCETFLANPAKYEPAFGGYCAYGVAANGVKVPTNPETFRIRDGELLLFFNDQYEGQHVDTSQVWDADPATFMAQAVTNWPTAQPLPR